MTDEAAENRTILESQSLGALLAIRDNTAQMSRYLAAVGLALVLLATIWMVGRVQSQQ